jgi:hypothetical protein
LAQRLSINLFIGPAAGLAGCKEERYGCQSPAQSSAYRPAVVQGFAFIAGPL